MHSSNCTEGTPPAPSLAVDAGGEGGRRAALGAVLAAPLLGIAGPLVVWPALVAFVALPVMAAGHLAGAGRARFADEDAPRIADGLEWLLALYGWAALVTVRPPWRAGERAVRLGLPPQSAATPGRALARLVTGLPAALGLLVAGVVALVPWLALAATALVAGRRPAALRRPLERLLGAHAALLCRQATLRPARSAARG